jgi:hypothetical protein
LGEGERHVPQGHTVEEKAEDWNTVEPATILEGAKVMPNYRGLGQRDNEEFLSMLNRIRNTGMPRRSGLQPALGGAWSPSRLGGEYVPGQTTWSTMPNQIGGGMPRRERNITGPPSSFLQTMRQLGAQRFANRPSNTLLRVLPAPTNQVPVQPPSGGSTLPQRTPGVYGHTALVPMPDGTMTNFFGNTVYDANGRIIRRNSPMS